MENEEVNELKVRIAHLESLNDYLTTELQGMDELFKSIGFKYGVASAKMAAEEILRTADEEPREVEEYEN